MRRKRSYRGTVSATVVLGLAGLLASVVGARGASAQTCAGGGPCKLGDTGPGGGIVFYVKDGYRLEAAPVGWAGGVDDPKFAWCPKGQPGYGKRLATKAKIGSGLANTRLIVKVCGPDSAAGKAAAYHGGGKVWFLPSSAELREMLKMKADLGLTADEYATSTQSRNSTDSASGKSFGRGTLRAEIRNNGGGNGGAGGVTQPVSGSLVGGKVCRKQLPCT